MSQITVINFRNSEESPVLAAIINDLSSDGKFTFEVESCKVSPEVATILTFSQMGIIFACVKDKADLAELMIFLKRDSQKLNDVLWDCVVINSFDRRLVEGALHPLGIHAIYPADFNPSRLKEKIELFLANPKIPLQSTAPPDGKLAVEKASNGLERTPALNLEADFWLLDDPGHCRRTLNTWVINITGPSTKIGFWSRVSPGIWEFKVSEGEMEVFGVVDGRWCVHANAMPKLSWEDRRWTIQGQDVQLYYKTKDVKHFKIQTDGTTLKVAQNSLYAEMKRDLIRDSFSDKFVFSSEGTKSNRPKVFDDHDKPGKELEIKLTPPDSRAWGKNTGEELFSDDFPVTPDEMERPKAAMADRKKKLLEKQEQIKKQRQLTPVDRFNRLPGRKLTQSHAGASPTAEKARGNRKSTRQKLPKLSEESLDSDLEDLKTLNQALKIPVVFSVSAFSGDKTFNCDLVDASESYVYVFSELPSGSLEGPLLFSLSYEFAGEKINLSFQGRIIDESKTENGFLQLVCPDPGASESLSIFLTEIGGAVRSFEDHFYSSRKQWSI